jgi:hypothetical protein
LIWTPELRELFFKALLHRFDAHAEWEHHDYPSEAERAEYEFFLAGFYNDAADLIATVTSRKPRRLDREQIGQSIPA